MHSPDPICPFFRRLRRCAAAVLASFLLLDLAAQSAQTATGAIRGRVLDVQNGAYLNNARVTIAGSDTVVFTDQIGEYRIDGVPAGQAVVQVYYTGLPAATATVTVTP